MIRRTKRATARTFVVYALAWLVATVMGAVGAGGDPILAASTAATTSTALLALAIRFPHHTEDLADQVLGWLETEEDDATQEDDTDA